MPEVTIRQGLTINYRMAGDGAKPVLLLITGLGGLQEGWFRQVPYFQADYRVITLDNRGAGKSSVLDEPATIHDFATDTVAVLDELAITRAHVWGVSMGGKIAQELALNWPDRVDRLVLGCTSAGEKHRVEGPVERMRNSHARTEEEWFNEIVPLVFGQDYIDKNVASMRAFARGRAKHPQNSVGSTRQYEAYAGFDAWDRLPELHHRTLVITGDADRMTSPENSVVLANRLPNAVLAMIPGAGHSFHLEKPDLVNPLVGQFLESGELSNG